MKDWRQSRGWRNNNPVNIRRGEKWYGLRHTQTDVDFCQFITQDFGYRAAAKVLKSYWRLFSQQGIAFSVINILLRWAPASENNVNMYCNGVYRLLTGSPYTPPPDLPSPVTPEGAKCVGRLLAAMTCVECGCPHDGVDYHAIADGVQMGLGQYVSPKDIVL